MRERSSLVTGLMLLAVTTLGPNCGGSSPPATNPSVDCCQGDGPFCVCFDDRGAWDPTPAAIQDVALTTLGTHASCVGDGGKPYYQMRLGYNSRAAAQQAACSLDISPGFASVGWFEREAWCTEAICYWHREARIPYATGFRNSVWWFDWQFTNTGALRTYYETEGSTGGRGRWIDWTELDYESFELGINAPVPGAWVFIKRLNASGEWAGNSHSMMVDEMTVWRNAAGQASRIEVKILEGNTSGSIVANNRVIADIYDSTPDGTTDLRGQKRIVGFGVDLDSNGSLLYDASRLHYVFTTEAAPLFSNPRTISDPIWDVHYAPRLPAIEAYVKAVGSGPTVTSDSQSIPVSGIPDGHAVSWAFPANVDELAPKGFQVDVDLVSEYPIPVQAILLQWSGERLPQGYRVYWAGPDNNYRMATVPDLTEKEIPLDANGRAALPIPVVLAAQAVLVRHLRFVFPPGSLGGAVHLEELTLACDWGPDDDIDDP